MSPSTGTEYSDDFSLELALSSSAASQSRLSISLLLRDNCSANWYRQAMSDLDRIRLARNRLVAHDEPSVDPPQWTVFTFSLFGFVSLDSDELPACPPEHDLTSRGQDRVDQRGS